jgi:hypothetical protein
MYNRTSSNPSESGLFGFNAMLFKPFLFLFALATQSLLALGFTNPIKSKDGSDPFMVGHTFVTP